MIDRLRQLRELNEARTKGPWTFDGGSDGSGGYIYRYEDGDEFARQIASVGCWVKHGKNQVNSDAAFIAALANNADWLIGCVVRLQHAADQLDGIVLAIKKHGTNINPDFFIRHYGIQAALARAALEQK